MAKVKFKCDKCHEESIIEANESAMVNFQSGLKKIDTIGMPILPLCNVEKRRKFEFSRLLRKICNQGD